MGVDAAIVAIVGHAVQPLEQLLPGEGLTGMLCQRHEQIELGAGQTKLLALAGDAATVQVDLEIASADQPRLVDPPRTRRSTARTRATSSRGEKGLVM